jgi:hypothetical protein
MKSSLRHRNLSTRTTIFALVQQAYLAKKPCKKSADLHPRQGNILQRNILKGLTKPLFTTQNSWRPDEKIRPFSSVAPTISMRCTTRRQGDQIGRISGLPDRTNFRVTGLGDC